MNKVYIQDKKFERIDTLEKGEYENCTFSNCNFSETDLSNFNFAGCSFIGCNLSMVKLAKTVFQDISFKDSKLLGVNFECCNEYLIGINFDTCILNLSSFYKLKLKNARFKNCSIHEVDFTETDLTLSVFNECDLSGATFLNTILEKADLRKAHHYSIDPEQNKLKKAKFSLNDVTGLLYKYDIEIE